MARQDPGPVPVRSRAPTVTRMPDDDQTPTERRMITSVGSSRARQLRRQRQQTDRRRARQEVEAHKTQEQQARAAIREDLSRQRRRHAIALMMVILGAVIGVYHFFEHLDVVPAMTTSSGLDDVLVGWPMAFFLGIGAAIVYGK